MPSFFHFLLFLGETDHQNHLRATHIPRIENLLMAFLSSSLPPHPSHLSIPTNFLFAAGEVGKHQKYTYEPPPPPKKRHITISKHAFLGPQPSPPRLHPVISSLSSSPSCLSSSEPRFFSIAPLTDNSISPCRCLSPQQCSEHVSHPPGARAGLRCSSNPCAGG